MKQKKSCAIAIVIVDPMQNPDGRERFIIIFIQLWQTIRMRIRMLQNITKFGQAEERIIIYSI